MRGRNRPSQDMDLLAGRSALTALIRYGEADSEGAWIRINMLDNYAACPSAIPKIPPPRDDWNLAGRGRSIEDHDLPGLGLSHRLDDRLRRLDLLGAVHLSKRVIQEPGVASNLQGGIRHKITARRTQDGNQRILLLL